MQNLTLIQYFEWYLPEDGTHWRRCSARAKNLAKLGINMAWLPPAYKGNGGANDVGYAVYDTYDLGEFNQKGSVETKYGNREDYLKCIHDLQSSGICVLADIVLNHRIGADDCETIKATEILANDGFVVMPYMYPDLNVARDLVNAGAATIMPLASPIGSNKGLATKEFIQILIDEIDLPIIVDAGIGKPSQACEAMEMGAAAIMANTALATAGDLPLMASAFRQAIEAGRKAYLSGLGRVLTRGASASDPLTGFLRD